MFKSKKIKLAVTSFLLLVACWMATPKIYLHQFFHHVHNVEAAKAETEVKTANNADCDFENYNKPTYFNIFKFIFSFLPIKSNDDEKAEIVQPNFTNKAKASSQLRAPPVV